VASIAHTRRRGAIYHFRRTYRLQNGKDLNAMTSMRIACPRAARHWVALLNLRFESLCVRLFGNRELRHGLEVGDAERIFDSELRKALVALEEEREDAALLQDGFGYSQRSLRCTSRFIDTSRNSALASSSSTGTSGWRESAALANKSRV